MDEQPSAAQDYDIVKRVLIVDDDQSIRGLLQMALESEGYQVATAADGVAALELLTSTEDTWIVLLDIMLPGLDGVEVCARLCAAAPGAPRHRVALMTAGKLELTDCPPPARTLLRKPFHLDTLSTLVTALAYNQAVCANWPDQPEEPAASGPHR
jgi:two-component system, OmpR family, response regulator MprA